MRATIEFFVEGKTLLDVQSKVAEEWKRITMDKNATLPVSTEVTIKSTAVANTDYLAHVVIKTKVEE